MADTIRPIFIGFAFGATAGIAVGLWYASGMGKLDRVELEKELEAAEARVVQVQEQSEADLKVATEATAEARAALEACEKVGAAEPAP